MNISYYLKHRIPMCHRLFFRRMSQSKEYIENFCNDINNPFHFACRKWFLANQTLYTLKLYLFLNDVIFNIISQFHIILKFYLIFCFLFHVHINVEFFIHVFMHLFKRADGFYMIVYLLCDTLVEHPTSFVEASQKRRSSKSEQ